ncbi:MAG: hypothetical protein ACRECJ_04670 [Limisphaerales bacterium]
MKSKRWGLAVVWLVFGLRAAFADDTGYKNPATAAGQFTNPGNVASSNDARAVEGTVGDTMACWDFSFNLPADAQSINGILIEAEGRLLESPPQGGGSTADLQIRLSWNGGTNWTSAKTDLYTDGEGEFYHGFGGSADTWGRSWTVTETNNANFRVSLKYSREDISQDQIEIDHLRAKIFYTPASGGSSPRRARLFKK